MALRPKRDALQTPNRLDTRFGFVAGLYVATLVSPPLLLTIIVRFQLRNGPFVLGLLGMVGMVCTAIFARLVTHRGGLVAWLHSTWLAWLVPTAGIIPMFAYAVLVLRYIAFTVTDLRTESAVTLIGFAGFLLGIVALCLGSVVVIMARSRLVNATVGDSDVDIEWTTSWPRRDRFKCMIGTLFLFAPLVGLFLWQTNWWAIYIVSTLGLLLILSLQSVMSERTYRVSPVGLERRREGRWAVSRQLTPWSQFAGFSVTDDALILHRQLPHLDIRCSLRDSITDEADVVAVLETYLSRRDS